MKKIILSFILAMVTIVSFGQDHIQNARKELNVEHILCNCHIDFHYGIKFNRSNDTIVYAIPIQIYNDNEEYITTEFHYDKVNKNKIDDSLRITPFGSAEAYVDIMNYATKRDNIANKFKYGYIDNWSWNTNSVDGINFNISYTNTNAKTIKYIDIYFIVKNPVGDICKLLYNSSNTGHLRCVGPIEQFETGTYNWEAVYYTTGDASNLHFTKFVITYMDNSKYTLIKELAYKYYPYD